MERILAWDLDWSKKVLKIKGVQVSLMINIDNNYSQNSPISDCLGDSKKWS